MENRKLSTWLLTWPLFLEMMLKTLLMTADTFMLSRYADEAAAAVGMLQQLSFFIMLLYMMASSGATILISQNLGAKRHDTAAEIGRTALLFNLMVGLIISQTVRLSTPALLGTMGLEPLVESYAREYFVLYSGFSFFLASGLVLGAILRSHGYSKTPMMVSISTNILNIIGNYLLLFGPFGIPVLGVTGVAISTVTSQAIGTLVQLYLVFRIKDIRLFRGKFFALKKEHLRSIFKVGIPAAGENLAYNTSQIVLIYMVTSLGTSALAAYTYASNIVRYGFVIAMSIGMATQIQTGHLVGAAKPDKAFRLVRNNTLWGMAISVICTAIIALFRKPLMGLLTDDPEILKIGALLVLLSVIHEVARPINFIVINGLRGAGDVRFPVLVGMASMWGLSIPLCYLLGIHLAWGMAGIWIGRMAEEWFRSAMMALRWKKGRWRSKSLVS